MTRHVFYIHGFDPRGPAPYHAICKEAAEGRAFAVSDRRNVGKIVAAWQVSGVETSVEYEFLRYDDLVRRLWPRWQGFARYRAGLRVLSEYTRAGLMKALRRSAPRMFAAVLKQALGGPAAVLVALFSAFVAWEIAARAASALGAPILVAAFAPLAALAAAVPLWRRIEARGNLAWFTRSLAYVLESAYGEIDRLEARSDEFALRITEAWRRGEASSLVVVGHSIGALFAVRALARASEIEPEIGRSGPSVGLLTLGQSIPLYTCLEHKGRFALDLVRVAETFRWIDVTSPIDPAATGTLSILTGTSVTAPPRTMLSLPAYPIDAAQLGRAAPLSPLEFHFQYLRATDSERGFDYLTLISSDWTKAGERLSHAA